MAIQVLGPTASTSSLNASSYTVPLANTKYTLSDKTFLSGVYTITTFPTSSQVQVTFSDTSGNYAETTTTSGTVTFNVAFDSTLTSVRTDTGTNIVITLERTAESLAGVDISGTLDTITSSGTYNQTGKLFVVAISGGMGGGKGGSGPAYPNTGDEFAGGRGGQGGSWAAYGPAQVNTATTVTIGTGGNGEAGTNSSNTGGSYGSYGGTTSFGNYAVANQQNVSLNRTNGGNPNGDGNFGPGVQTSTVLFKNIGNGTNGGGGAGAGVANGAGNGGGSGIGTGGAGSSNNTLAGSSGTGYGAGGGGGRQNGRFNGTSGGAGSPGVIYVLRGF